MAATEEKQRKVVGQVIGSTTLRGFRFVIKEGAEENVRRDEFVSVKENVTGHDILGIVKEITISNELLPDEFGRDMRLDNIVLSEGEYPVPTVKILGYESGDGLELPRYGIKPGSQVELVDDETLGRILRQDESKSAYLGTLSTRESIPVNISINELVSKHCAVLAMTGAGKSYTVGVLIEELIKKKGAVVVFDPHGEYKGIRFPDAAVKVYGIEDKDRIKIDTGSLRVSDFISMIPDLTSTQKDLLDEILSLSYRFYEKYDLNVILRILGIIYDVKKGGERKDKAKKDKAKDGDGGDLEAKDADEEKTEIAIDTDIFPEKILKEITRKVGLSTIGALMRRIRRLEKMGIFAVDGVPLQELVKRNQLTVINLSEAEERVSEIIVAAVCREIFDARKRHMKGDPEGGSRLSTPVFIIIEEAHNFAPRSVTEEITPSRNILRRIAREGRKFGVGLCVVSQRPNKLDSDVLSQCNTQIIMRIVNPSDQEHIRQSVETVTEDIVRDLPSLSRGEAIIVGAAIKLPVPVRIRTRTTEIGGEDVDIVGLWSKE